LWVEKKRLKRRNFIFLVSTKCILNVTTLAAYLEMSPVLEIIPKLAKKLRIKKFNFDELVETGKSLPNTIVVGLENFVKSGFSNPDFDFSAHCPVNGTENGTGKKTKKRKSQTDQSEPVPKKAKPDKVKNNDKFNFVFLLKREFVFCLKDNSL